LWDQIFSPWNPNPSDFTAHVEVQLVTTGNSHPYPKYVAERTEGSGREKGGSGREEVDTVCLALLKISLPILSLPFAYFHILLSRN
jgi:hypothetical protein